MLTLKRFKLLPDGKYIDVLQILQLRWTGIIACTQICKKYTLSDSCGGFVFCLSALKQLLSYMYLK